MRRIFLDTETHMDLGKGLTLQKMSLRAYLPLAPVIGLSVAVDDLPPTWVPVTSPDFVPLIAELDEAGQDPDTVLIAYNVAFDMRVLRYGVLEAGGDVLGCRWPLKIHDAMELAMAAWPNMPGGYSLRNVASWLCLPPKLSMEDIRHGRCTWEEYCNRDCELLQAIYNRALARISEEELFYAENCNRVRGLAYQIKRDTVQASIEAFRANAEDGVEAALDVLSNQGADGETCGYEIFGGYREGQVRSVKPLALRDMLRSVFGFSTQTTSLKKINPNLLADRPDVNELLTATSRTSKSLYYKNRATAMSGVDEIDMEKGYFRATNTGRTSAPTVGRGINSANLTKKDKKIAKPLRQMLALPDDICYVRADAANVEYRCLLEGTPVLTDSGWKKIESVLDIDLVWDGLEWVKQKGAICKGTRHVQLVHGVWMTPDHLVLTPEGWKPAAQVAMSACPSLGAYSGDGRLQVNTRKTLGAGIGRKSGAHVVGSGASQPLTSCAEYLGNVVHARQRVGGGCPSLWRIREYSVPWLAATRTSSAGVSTRKTTTSRVTGGEGLAFTTASWTGKRSSGILSRSLDTTTSLSPLTGSMSTETTPLATCASPLGQCKTATKGRVYDLLDAGPRNRFQAGALIVHNCGGLLAGTQYVIDLFSSNIDVDPYAAYALAAFGVKCTKGEPMRDIVAKTAVLAYQFGMGNGLAVSEMNKAVADPANKVSVKQMHDLCLSRGWKEPNDRYLKGVITKVGCHWSIGVAAYESRKAFHAIHPEMFRMGDWLVDAVTQLSGHPRPDALLDSLYARGDAPDRNKLELSIDTQLEFPTVRVRLFGHTMPTVTWRHLSCSHPGIQGLGAVTANKGPRNVHRSLFLGNVTQSSARIGLLRCENELARRGWLTDSVYDEILVICPRERNAVLRARADLIDVMGPNGPHQMGWAFYAKPPDITVTRTRYESEEDSALAWKKLEANDDTWTEHLL